MQPFAGKATAPSDDRRWKLVDATMRKHGRVALIESLHTVQELVRLSRRRCAALCSAVVANPDKVHGFSPSTTSSP